MENNQNNGGWWAATFGEDQPGTNDRKGSLAELNDTPKAAVRAAGIEGIADLAIRRMRPFVSGKF